MGTYYRFCLRWVCEQEKASQPHYHCWIALPHRSVRWFGTPERGSAGIITEIWMKLTGGKATLVNLSKATKDYPDHYVIHREYPSSLEGPIFWLSYLAKERGKLQTGKGTRMYSTSKLSSKALNS
ncbi:inovirus Gp2 family protein [Enterobacter hormaechei]|nr:inovirus Gp2 family protein [Enterobacter hormaechei]